jgi:hypothetical protein
MVWRWFYAPEEDQAIADAVRAGAWRDRDFRDLASRLGRSDAAVRERALRLGLVQRAPPRDSAPFVELDRAAQAKACAKHARACLKAGGFWALSERRVGAGKWAVCLPLIPPPARLEDAA